VPALPSSRDYSALRGIAQLFTWLSYGVLLMMGLGVISSLIAFGDSFLSGVTILIPTLVIGGFFYIIAKAGAESILVLLDIEENTRLAAMSMQESVKILDERLG